jgi:hypothetical protein
MSKNLRVLRLPAVIHRRVQQLAADEGQNELSQRFARPAR